MKTNTRRAKATRTTRKASTRKQARKAAAKGIATLGTFAARKRAREALKAAHRALFATQFTAKGRKCTPRTWKAAKKAARIA